MLFGKPQIKMLKVESNYNNMPLTGNGPAYSSAYKSLLTLAHRVFKAQKTFFPTSFWPKTKRNKQEFIWRKYEDVQMHHSGHKFCDLFNNS